MVKGKKPVWLAIGVIVLALLLNIIILRTAYSDSQNPLWMLIASGPLLIIAVFYAWQTNHLLRKYVMDVLQLPASQQHQSEWLSHSIYPNKITSTDLEVQIGNDQCNQPYNACIFNIESMKDSKVERLAHHSLNDGKLESSKYSVDEGLDTYHLATGGLVWQICSGFVGCRTENGNFCSKSFKETARRPEVKMIELKLSSADAAYSTFTETEGMIYFLNNLRELSGGKPIGIRLCINNKKEVYRICHAIRKTQIIPDFIVVEGSIESAGIGQTDEAFHVGMPLYDAVLFVSQTLQVYALAREIKIIASGRIISGFDILKILALGANVVCTEIPDYTSDGRYISTLYKSRNANDFHSYLMKSAVRAMKVCGFTNVADISLSKLFRGLDMLHSREFEKFNDSILYPGTVKRLYTEKLKSYSSLEERRTVQYRTL